MSGKTDPVQFKRVLKQRPLCFLKTLTSLFKEVRPFFLGDTSIWTYPSVSSFSDYSAIIAFGAFGFIVPKNFYH